MNRCPSLTSFCSESLHRAASRRSHTLVLSPAHPPRPSKLGQLKTSLYRRGYSASLDCTRSTTHDVSQLGGLDGSSDIDVVLHGYVGTRADLSKALSFIPLFGKGLSHSVQIVSQLGEAGEAEHAKLKTIRPHTPVWIRGRLKERKEGKRDVGFMKNVKTREVLLKEIVALNTVPDNVVMSEETVFSAKQRHLQIRTQSQLRRRLFARSKIASLCRRFLEDEQSFLEVETPILFKSTAEGAREFLVPSRRAGTAYALPQSPQQYKQILMASGIPRYFQLARCFRDEDLRADRQPEFTQLDLEMAFATSKDVMAVVELLIRRLWSEHLSIDLPPDAFPRISYHDAMSLYGSDKPDVRLGMQITSLCSPRTSILPPDLVAKITDLKDPTVEAIKLRTDASISKLKKFTTEFLDSTSGKQFSVNPDGQPGIFVFDSRAPLNGLSALGFEAAEQLESLMGLGQGDLVILQARQSRPFTGGSTVLGNLRSALHAAATAHGLVPAPMGHSFAWITDFPLFTVVKDGSEGGESELDITLSTHHPFTSPNRIEELYDRRNSPTTISAAHYDLVLNGIELGGGSQRIHDAKVQRYVFEELLRMPAHKVAEFSHLLDALASGCPPHAGIALGFDRLVAVMTGTESVRDVIPFPKTGKGEDAMVGSPGKISNADLEPYHLKLEVE